MGKKKGRYDFSTGKNENTPTIAGYNIGRFHKKTTPEWEETITNNKEENTNKTDEADKITSEDTVKAPRTVEVLEVPEDTFQHEDPKEALSKLFISSK